MAEFFGRDVKVMAGPLTIEPRTEDGFEQPLLKMTFTITKTIGREPNRCELTIWNLTKNSRGKLEGDDIEVVIEAGYVDEIGTIFKGDLDYASTTKESTDWITKLEVGDGAKQMRKSRINETFRGGTSAGQILQKAADALGLDAGNLQEKVRQDGARSVLKEFVSGFILSGKAVDVLDDVAASLGLNMSVQDKKLQFLSKGETLQDPPIPISAGTGLIGSPERGEKGTVNAKVLLNGKIRPGIRINMDSLVVSGLFRAEKVVHKGDTWGADWFTEMELKRL